VDEVSIDAVWPRIHIPKSGGFNATFEGDATIVFQSFPTSDSRHSQFAAHTFLTQPPNQPP
jgi:hypothetical protein